MNASGNESLSQEEHKLCSHDVRQKKPIKVVVLGTRGFPHVQGGVERYCEQLYPRLVNFGCDVTVFTRTPYIPRENRTGSWKGVKFVHLWCPRYKSMETIAHTFYGVLRAIFESPDIVHIHCVGPSLVTPIAKLLGMKVVMTHQGPDYMRKKWGKVARHALRLGETLGVRFSDRIIVVSKGIQQHVKDVFGRNTDYVPNGVSAPTYIAPGNTLRKWQLEPRNYAFTATRFVPEKGLHDLINAYKLISNASFKLVIAGDADHESDYSKSIRCLASETEGVVITGFQSGENLAELFSNAGFFVLPSYFEGLPLALLEALSYGLPVAVSDIPQHREVPLDNRSYFPVGNVRALADLMTNTYKRGISEFDKESYKTLCRKTYDWDTIAAKVFDIYKAVCINRNNVLK